MEKEKFKILKETLANIDDNSAATILEIIFHKLYSL
jgi:hypothetical protein